MLLRNLHCLHLRGSWIRNWVIYCTQCRNFFNFFASVSVRLCHDRGMRMGWTQSHYWRQRLAWIEMGEIEDWIKLEQNMEINNRSAITLSLCFCISSCFSVLNYCIQVVHNVNYFQGIAVWPARCTVTYCLCTLSSYLLTCWHVGVSKVSNKGEGNTTK